MKWFNALVSIMLIFSSCSENKEENEKGNEFDPANEIVQQFPRLQLLINEVGMGKIAAKRQEALKKKVLETSKKDFVQALLVTGKDTLNCQVRLKGDWTQHLEEDKWSFRILLNNKKKWMGMSSFSVQNPKARYFLSSWAWHKMMEQEQVPTTQYLFGTLTLNGKELGVYAIEEHFTAAMLERLDLPKGVILKLEEDEFWADRAYDSKATPNVPFFEASTIDNFPGFDEMHEHGTQKQKAINLIYDFKFCLSRSNLVFEAEKAGMFFALLDLHRAYHNLFWHNQRFYYNPQTQKLQLVGYDGFTETGLWLSTKKQFIGKYKKGNKFLSQYRCYYHHLLDNQETYKNYLEALKKVSNKEYLDDFYEPLQKDIDLIEKLIKLEYKDYKFDQQFLYYSATRIDSGLQETSNEVLEKLPMEIKPFKANLPDSNILPIQNVSLQPYSFNDTLFVQSYYHKPIELTGLGSKSNESSPLDRQVIEPYLLRPFPPKVVKIPFKTGHKWVYYKVNGKDPTFKAKIKKDPPPYYKLQ